MEELYLYKRVAESVRHQILVGELKPGDHLPSIREMKQRWNCTLGTIQRAYHELAQQGLTVSRPGQGTRITDQLSTSSNMLLRQINLVNKAENFLLEVMTAGYLPDEIEQSVRLALDHFRALGKTWVAPLIKF